MVSLRIHFLRKCCSQFNSSPKRSTQYCELSTAVTGDKRPKVRIQHHCRTPYKAELWIQNEIHPKQKLFLTTDNAELYIAPGS